MLTDVSKNQATFNGKKVRLERVTLKNYRGGQFYIRVYMNNYGDVGYDVMRVLGSKFKHKNSMKFGRKDRICESLGHDYQIKTVDTPYDSYWSKLKREGKSRLYFTGDLGLTPGGGTLFRFSHDALNVLKELSKRKDRPNAIRLFIGLTDKQLIAEKISRMDFDRMMDSHMDRLYDYDSL